MWRGILAGAFALVLGCGGADATQVGGAPVSFSVQVQPILESRCVACHSGPEPLGGLDLTQRSSHASLLNAVETCRPENRLVVPRDPENSALMQKLDSSPNCGLPMPKGTDGLKTVAPSEFDKIRRWIQQGAPDN